MKAAVLTKWKHFEICNLDVPQAGTGEVLLKVGLAGICGSDVHIYNGDNPIAKTPVIPGHEFMGEIVAMGDDVSDLKIGQRVVVQPLVFCGDCPPCNSGVPHVCESLTVIGVNRNGGFADYVNVPKDCIFPISDDLSDAAATLAEPFSIAVHSLKRGGLLSTDRVLVIGAGPIGFYSALMARKMGAKSVMISEPVATRRAFVEEFGISVCNPMDDDSVEQLKLLSDGNGYDLIIETSGNAAGIDFATKAAAIRGRIVTLGFPAKNYAQYNFTSGIIKELTIIGSRVCTRAEFAETLELICSMNQEGEVNFSKLVAVTRSLEDLDRSILDVAEGVECAKILIHLNAGDNAKTS